MTLKERLIEKHGGYWDGDVPDAPVANWKYEVANSDTRLGYWDWVAAQKTEEEIG